MTSPVVGSNESSCSTTVSPSMKMVFVLISGPSEVGAAEVVGEALEVEVEGIEDEEGLEVDRGPEDEEGDPEDGAWVEDKGVGDSSGKLDVAEVELIDVGVSPDVDGHVSVCLYSPSLKHQTESSSSFSFS